MTPARDVDILVIGAGVIGAACAYELAKRGRRVLLIDGVEPASGASGACDGFISVCTKVPGPMMDLAVLGQSAYPSFVAELEAGIELHRPGGLMLIEGAVDEPAMLAHARQLESARVRVEHLDAARLHVLEPALNPELRGALLCPDELQVTPYLLVFALLRAARVLGVEMHWRTRVSAFRRSSGAIAEVALESDDGATLRIAPEQVVLCAGAWTAAVGEQLGLNLPVVPRRGELVVTAAGRPLARHFLVSGRYLTHKLDPQAAERSQDPLVRLGYGFTMETTQQGQHIIGNTRTFSGFDRTPSAEALNAIMRQALRYVPALSKVVVLRGFAGLRPFVFDRKPLLGRSRLICNLLVAAGHEGEGVTLAPLTGRIIADLAEARAPCVDLVPFDPDRFGATGDPLLAA